jgi:benzoyl-CoA reductase/2-hydroxyglutaryl-CoA dehydratase subunit BcrC/BadD/HgdB
MDPMEALAQKYLNIACPCMSPNTDRLELLKGLVEKYKVDGVVELTWQACHTYNVEAFQIKEYVTQTLNKPYIQIETDYSENDNQQIKTRLEAFLEMIN